MSRGQFLPSPLHNSPTHVQSVPLSSTGLKENRQLTKSKNYHSPTTQFFVQIGCAALCESCVWRVGAIGRQRHIDTRCTIFALCWLVVFVCVEDVAFECWSIVSDRRRHCMCVNYDNRQDECDDCWHDEHDEKTRANERLDHDLKKKTRAPEACYFIGTRYST